MTTRYGSGSVRRLQSTGIQPESRSMPEVEPPRTGFQRTRRDGQALGGKPGKSTSPKNAGALPLPALPGKLQVGTGHQSLRLSPTLQFPGFRHPETEPYRKQTPFWAQKFRQIPGKQRGGMEKSIRFLPGSGGLGPFHQTGPQSPAASVFGRALDAVGSNRGKRSGDLGDLK